MKLVAFVCISMLCSCSPSTGPDTAAPKPVTRTENPKTRPVLPVSRGPSSVTAPKKIGTAPSVTAAGGWVTMKSWGIRLHATKRFLAKYRTRPKPHISLPTSAESSHVEQYSFSWDYDRRHAIFIDLRKVVGPAPTLFSELDKDPFARRKGYGGTKGHLRYKVGYKKIRGPGHCSRGRCMHMLIDELNGIAVLPLTPKSYIMCHVSVPREGDPKAKTFTDLFNICLSIQKIP